MSRGRKQTGVRTFIAVFPPADVQAAIHTIQSSLKADGTSIRWEQPTKFHITVKFLGNLPVPAIESLRTRLSALPDSFGRFGIQLTTLGCFPSPQSPKVIWIGGDPNENIRLSECSAAVEDLCESAGIKKEARSFRPHITVGRVKGKIPPLLIKKIENTTFEPIQFLCSELLVMKSDLSPSGSAYSQLFIIPLKH